MTSRIERNVIRQTPVTLTIDDMEVQAWQGETLATVLLLNGYTSFNQTAISDSPRAPFCNMGTCFECRVQLQNKGWVLACMTPVEDGMQVKTAQVLPLTKDNNHAN